MHYWFTDRWSCSGCEHCIFPSSLPEAKPFVAKAEELHKKADQDKAQVTSYVIELNKTCRERQISFYSQPVIPARMRA